MRAFQGHLQPRLAVLPLSLILTGVLSSPAFAGGDEVALVVDGTLIEPLAEDGRVSTSLGHGAEIRFMPNREPVTVSIGGYYALGQLDGDKTMRDIYDFHFDVGFKKERSRDKILIPYISVGLDILHMTTRIPDDATHRGITVGLNAQAGFLGHISKNWVYRVSGTYLGAIVPGTGDDLGGLVLQAGIGKIFND